MMSILLHGALGSWDEFAFGLCVPLVVITVLYISWANRPLEEEIE